MLEHNKQIVFVRINPNIDLEVKARTFFWVLQIRSGIFAVLNLFWSQVSCFMSYGKKSSSFRKMLRQTSFVTTKNIDAKKTWRKDKNTCTASGCQSPRYTPRRWILHGLLRSCGDHLPSPDAFPGRLEYSPVQYEDDQ